jgi:hypothetical protein
MLTDSQGNLHQGQLRTEFSVFGSDLPIGARVHTFKLLITKLESTVLELICTFFFFFTTLKFASHKSNKNNPHQKKKKKKKNKQKKKKSQKTKTKLDSRMERTGSLLAAEQ